MKKSLFLVFVMIIASIMLSACGEGRDLSTPSSRLVGHWRSINTVAMSEYYFGEIDKETGKGSFAEYEARDGTLANGTYVVVNETPEGEAITIRAMLFGYENSDIPSSLLSPEMNLEVQENGLKARMMNFYIEYVDDKTEFDPSDPATTRMPTLSPIPTPTLDPSITIYQVLMDNVGFYENPTDDNPQHVFNMKERVIPANGASTRHCEFVQRASGPVRMCHLYSPRLGVDGWAYSLFIGEVD